MRHRSKLNKALMILTAMFAMELSVLVMVGCATVATAVKPVPHPNQLSAFDGEVYDSLTAAQGALDTAKIQYKCGLDKACTGTKLPKSAKASINIAGSIYEVTRMDWTTWRDIINGLREGDSVALQAKLRQDMTDLSGAIIKVKSIAGGSQ